MAKAVNAVVRQGTSTYVIGTDDVREALKGLGISPETHAWGSTCYGNVVRRQGYWKYHSGYPRLPKDAKPCVSFHGKITARNQDGA